MSKPSSLAPTHQKRLYYALRLLIVFFVPILTGLLFFKARSIYPFGDNSLLSIDLWGQYFPMFRQYAMSGSLSEAMYSWNGALGFNNFVQSAFYCHSPFLWLFKLIPLGQSIHYIDVVCLLRLGLSALTCQIFLEYKFKNRSPILMALSVSYGLCAYAVAYIMQFMWTDLIVIAPIVLLGLELLLERRTPIVYVAALSFAIYANFYVAFGVCIFTAVYFVAELIKRTELDLGAKRLRKIANGKYLAGTFGRFTLYSVLAGVLNAVTILPTLLGLSLSASASATTVDFDKWYHTFAENINAMLPQTEISLGYGVANIATGLFVFVLLPLYFFNTSIRFREKLATGGLLVFLYCGLNYNPLDFLFNGGHFPNQLPGRWSFLFSLAIVVTAANGIAKIGGIKLKTIISSLAAGVAFLMLSEYSNLSEVKESYLSTWIVWLVLFSVLFACYILFRAHYRRLREAQGEEPTKKQITKTKVWHIVSKVCCVALAVVMSVELCSNAIVVASELNGGVGTSSITVYNHVMGLLTKYGKMYDSPEDTFYRTETNEGWTFDDGQLGGFKAVSYYGSTMNGRTFRLLRHLGNRVYTQNISSLYNNSSPVQNSLFGIRYFIDRGKYLDKRLWGVSKVAEYEDAFVWENPTPFPLAFAAADGVKEITLNDGPNAKDELRAITAQNDFINKLYGSELNVFELQEAMLSYENCTLIPSENWMDSTYQVVNVSMPTVFTYTYVCADDRPVYFEQNFKNGKMIVKVNDQESEVNMLTEPFKYVGSYPAGTVVTVTVTVQNGGGGKYGLDFYTLNPEKWQTVYNSVTNSGLEVTSFKTTKVKGTMTAASDTAVFTSIPQDEGWKVYVDGKKAETYLIADTLVGFDLSAGTHEITFKYSVPGYAIGLVGTLLALAAIVFCLWWRRYRRLHPAQPKPKKVRVPVTVSAQSKVVKIEEDPEAE